MPAADHHTFDPIPPFPRLLHDLRNQLTILVACTDAVSRAVPAGVAAAEIAAMVTSTRRAVALTEEFLVGAVIGAHPRSEPSVPLDLNAVTRSIVAAMRQIAGDRARLELRLSPEAVALAADIVQLERILVNLVLNACESMPDGGTVLVETALVPAAPPGAGGPAPALVRLTVRDTGRGMSPEVKGRMFEPLFTTKPRGMGLGLNAVAHTVRELQGTTSVESDVDRGTAVSVILPVAAPR